MTTHDSRKPLNQGDRLTLRQRDYTVREIVGFGGSCFAYYAECDPDDHEREVGMPTVPAVIKEFYPLELAADITRVPSGELTVRTEARDMFDTLRSRFESGATEQTAFCVSDGNHSLPHPALAAANGTVYTAVALTNGQTLAKCAGTLSMLEKADVITSLCNAVKKLHDGGKLYLDLKPSNIFVFGKEQNESRRVALFDFDTVVSAVDIAAVVISYSEGWSPYEQANGQREEMSYTADVYSIGAVYYWLLSGEKVSEAILDEIVRGRFGFLDVIGELRGNKRLNETIRQILSATLNRLPSKRVQRVEDIPL
jgi:hypothetical protein